MRRETGPHLPVHRVRSGVVTCRVCNRPVAGARTMFDGRLFGGVHADEARRRPADGVYEPPPSRKAFTLVGGGLV